MKNYFIVLLLGFITSCQFTDQEKDFGEQPFDFVDLYKDSECSIYAMPFICTDDCTLRFALSGPCKELTSDVYIKTFDSYYKTFSRERECKDQVILIEFYEYIGDNLDLALKLRDIVKSHLQPHCGLNVKFNSLHSNSACIHIVNL